MTTSKDDVGKQVAAIAKEIGCKFYLKGAEVDVSTAFSSTGLLPEIMRRADQLCSFCLGYGLGVDFSQSDKSMVGVVVNFDDKGSSSLRLLCAADVLMELVQNSPDQRNVALDELM